MLGLLPGINIQLYRECGVQYLTRDRKKVNRIRSSRVYFIISIIKSLVGTRIMSIIGKFT